MNHLEESPATASSIRDFVGNQPWRWFWLALMLVPLPMFAHYLVWNWRYEQYHFFPLLLIAVAGLAYSRFDGVFSPPRRWPSWIAIGLGLIAVVGSLAWDTPWLSTVALVLFASALLATMAGPEDSSLLGLALPLWLLVRLPLGYDQLLVLWLQTITTDLTSVVLDVVRVPHADSGNVIQLADRELFVAEACSGIQSVFTLAFIASLLVAIHRRPMFMIPLYLVVACVLAVAANVLRVSTVAIGQAWFDLDLANGWSHEMVGYIALAAGIGLLLSFDHFLVVVIHPLQEADDIEFVDDEYANPFVLFWNWLTASRTERADMIITSSIDWQHQRTFTYVRRAMISVSTVLFCTSLVFAVDRRQPVEGMFAAGVPVLDVEPDLFDTAFSTLRVVQHSSIRDGENPRLGENADIWIVLIAEREAQLVLSQTYTGWHEFCLCYEADGWQLVNRETESSETNVLGFPFATALFTKDDQRIGHLVYGAIALDGEQVVPPPLIGRLTMRFDPSLEASKNVIMLQLWIAGDEKLETTIYADVKKDFAKAVAIVASELGKRNGTASTDEVTKATIGLEE